MFLWPCLAVALLLGPPGVFASDPSPDSPDIHARADLRPHFAVGRSATYDLWTQRTTRVVLRAGSNTRTQDSSVEFQGRIRWSVNQLRADGSASCTMTTEWIAATVTAPDGSTQVSDSRRPRGRGERLDELLRALASHPIRCEVAADGSVLRITGGDTVRRALSDPDSGPSDRDFIETATGLATLHASPSDLPVGRSWSTRHQWDHELGELREDAAHTLSGIEVIAGVPVASVASRSRLRLDPDDSKLPGPGPNGPKVDVRMTAGDIDSQTLYDLWRHEAVGRNSITRRGIEIRLSFPQGTITRSIQDTIHGQIIRVAESG